MTPPPPAELAHLTDLIGADALLRLIEAYGCTRLYIPETPTEDTLLAKVIGLRLACIMANRYGGDYLKVPLSRNWRVRVYRARGWSYAEIARHLGMTESTVGKILHAAGITQRQLTLFS